MTDTLTRGDGVRFGAVTKVGSHHWTFSYGEYRHPRVYPTKRETVLALETFIADEREHGRLEAVDGPSPLSVYILNHKYFRVMRAGAPEAFPTTVAAVQQMANGATPTMPSYVLRDIDAELWRQVKTKAASNGITIKALLLQLLREWLAL